MTLLFLFKALIILICIRITQIIIKYVKIPKFDDVYRVHDKMRNEYYDKFVINIKYKQYYIFGVKLISKDYSWEKYDSEDIIYSRSVTPLEVLTKEKYKKLKKS